MLIIFFLLPISAVTLSVILFMKGPSFGKAPSGSRLKKIEKSVNYKDKQFQNLSHTPPLAEGVTYGSMLKEFFFKRNKKSVPPIKLESKKTNLHQLNLQQNILVWFGHSSYYMQLDGKRILVDPVLSGNASPIKNTVKSFKGSDVYTPDDIPEIDYLFISHDHWDHLDYKTVKRLKGKVKTVITGLGTGEHLEFWGYKPEAIIEKDWNEEILLPDGFKVNTTPARHFSGRGFKRNGSLWMSFVLTTPNWNIYLGGDSGYDTHFKTIGERFGPFDLAILENGQYDRKWKYIHMMPEETVQAAIDLKAKVLFPIHWGKFALALHDWDDSIIRVTREAQKRELPIIHPMIGETVELDKNSDFTKWWEKI